MTKKRLLIIDDNSKTLAVMKQILIEAGYEVRSTQDPELAEEIASEFKPDLAILDIMMPGMDGFETALALAQLPGASKIPFMFLTVRGDPEIRRQAIDLGAVAFHEKPVKKGELLESLERFLSRPI